MTREQKLQIANTAPAWMYEFDLGDGVRTPLLDEELRSIHQTREQMVLSSIREVFPENLAGKNVLDVACNEGYFSQMLYHRGATVRAIDIREQNIERARIIQSLFGLDAGRLVFAVEDFLENRDPERSYDLTLFLGVLYHLENPMGALRLLRRVTKTLCIIETQLTRFNSTVESGWGREGETLHLPASLAIHQETDMEQNRLASHRSLSFIPNIAAVKQMLKAAGFSKVTQVPAWPGMNPQYLSHDRGVFLAFV
ncbi:MAG: methyltransferase domain-containing protein [Acidobacteria bacterium]|nr:methyltransferase domain-containing protein [Acidobacteriota bacterium]